MSAGVATADRLAACYDAGREPDGAADVKALAMGLDVLVHTRRLAAAGWAARRLIDGGVTADVVAHLELLLRAVPPPTGDGAYDDFEDDAAADVQVVRRRDASGVLFVFTGISGRAGMPLPLAHRWFGALDTHVVYLRDTHHQAYNLGVEGLGGSYEATLGALSELAGRLGSRRIAVFGNSVGGFGALRYGLDLRADASLAFSPLTSMAPPLTSQAELARRGLRLGLDLLPFYRAATPPPRTSIVYNADFEPDRRQALHLEHAPRVRLESLTGSGRHDSVLQAVEQGRFAHCLSHLAIT